ncbi:hypothetical protein O7621_08340 [Solwaraspora sp. WMMD937]|uniref:hypothetical protein n=1 Tax=Solwaraspora sp. WMMD937 TaxID=3016090 RepID=UPI00249B1E1A|nr:hypothetical protein [Solwaraspora sp. WMMD937]WFE23297.1 hypothetical protein O7621_08340 [Solwaraspora sp. WMMD937]
MPETEPDHIDEPEQDLPEDLGPPLDVDQNDPTDEPEAELSLDQAIEAVRRAGFDAEPSRIDVFVDRFSSRPRWISLFKVGPNGKKQPMGILPTYAISSFLDELDASYIRSESGLSIASSDGKYVELMISPGGSGVSLMSLFRGDDVHDSIRLSCPQAGSDPEHQFAFRTAFGRSDRPVSVSDLWGSDRYRKTVAMHLSNMHGDCLEISIPSATMAGAFYQVANGFHPVNLPKAASIKFRFTAASSVELAIKKAEKIAASLFFELAALGRHTLRLHEPPKGRRRRLPKPQDYNKVPRYPPQYVDPRASSFFVGAADAPTPLSAYLSYYQSIEYFLPYSDERTTIDRLRREIFSPGFDLADNKSLLQLARAAGRQAGKSERESFQNLLNFALSSDKAEAVFSSVQDRFKDHFGRRGPISGVGEIHIQGKQAPLVSQIAARIYDLRCRIVHSKVDGGSTGTDPLFPTDPQVDQLQPDIELVQLVATEVITAFATPSFQA